jgi:hypothetical protein
MSANGGEGAECERAIHPERYGTHLAQAGACSKKMENHAHAMALHFMYYYFVRIHKTLRTTPAMAARMTKRLWEIGDICGRAGSLGGRQLTAGGR